MLYFETRYASSLSNARARVSFDLDTEKRDLNHCADLNATVVAA